MTEEKRFRWWNYHNGHEVLADWLGGDQWDFAERDWGGVQWYPLAATPELLTHARQLLAGGHDDHHELEHRHGHQPHREHNHHNEQNKDHGHGHSDHHDHHFDHEHPHKHEHSDSSSRPNGGRSIHGLLNGKVIQVHQDDKFVGIPSGMSFAGGLIYSGRPPPSRIGPKRISKRSFRW